MGWVNRYAYEIYLAITLLACSVVGGYLGGRLAMRDVGHREVTVDSRLGPTFGQPEPTLVARPAQERGLPSYTL